MYIAQNKKTYANISNDGGSVAINPVTTYLTTVSLKKTATPLAALTAPSAPLQSNSIAPSPIVSSRPTPLPVTAVAALPLRTQQQGQGLVLTKDTKRFTQPKGVYVSAQTAGCTRSLDSSSDNKENHRLSNLNENAATNNNLTASSTSVLDSDTMILLKSFAVVKSTTDLLQTMKMSGSKGDENKDDDACSIYSPVMSGNNINGPTSPPLMDTATEATIEASSPEAASSSSGNNMFMFDNRKRKHNMSRRGTLSPGTARAMMLEAFAMDTRRQDNSNSSRSAFSSPLKLISNTSFDCSSSSSSSSPLKQLINTIAGSMDIVVCDDEDDSATIQVSNDSLDNSSKNSRGTAEDSITIPQRLDSIIIECKSSSSSKDDDASSSRAESPLQKFQRSESPDPSIEQSQPTTGDGLDINGDDDRDDAVHLMDLEETAIDEGASVGIEGLGMVMVTEGKEEIASMEAYGKELDSLLCDVSSSDVEQLEAMGIDPSLSTNMSIDTYSPTTPSVSSIINDDSLYISMDDCRDDDMSTIIPTADPIDCDVSNRSSSILTHASNNNNNSIIRPLPAIKLQYASPIPAQKRSSPLPSRYFLVETMDGAGVSDPESVFHIKCPSPMNQSLTASSVSSSSISFSLSSPSLKPPSPPNAPPSIKPSPLQKRAYNVSPIVCALSPLFNQSLSSIVTTDESTDGGVRDDDVIMQDTVNSSSDDDVERIHHLDTTEVINESSDAYREAAPFTPTSIVVKDDGLCDSDSREINKSSCSNSKPSTIIHDSCMDDASPYSLVQYYRKQLCPSSSSSSSDEQLLLGSDCSSFELLESMLEQEYLQCQGRDMRHDDSDGDSCESHSVEGHTTTTSPPVNCDSIHTDRASFSVDSELLLSSSISSSIATARSQTYCCPSSIITIDQHDVQSAQQTTVRSHVDDDGVDDACDILAPLDLVQIEVQAERRLKLRLEAAHWQYKWEMVMARLINTVIEKQRLKIADL